jgi:hypothetical protein
MPYMSKDARMAEEQRLINRWDWLTEDIDDYEQKYNTSLVLENSYDNMMANNQVSEGWLEANVLNEDEQQLDEAPTLSTDAGTNLIPRILFPIIRRVYPTLIANKLVSIQPIQARTGVIYYIRYDFTNSKGGITADDEYTGVIQQGSPAFATWYTSEKIGPFTGTISAAGDSSVIDCGTQVTAFLGDTLYNALGALNFSLKRIEVYNNADGTQYSTTMQPVVAGGGAPTWSGEYDTYYDVSAGDIFLRDLGDSDGAGTSYSPWTAGDSVTVYVVYNQEASDDIPEMEFSIGSETVETTERKLKVRWTKEAEQDMRAYHKIDVEGELVKVASMEMNYEIDREIITFIGDQVQTSLAFLHDWTADSPNTGNNAAGNYLDRHRALAQKIYQVSAKIASYNRQGPASWAVVSPQISAVFNMLPDFKGEIAGGTFNVFEAGQLGSGLKVFVDPNRNNDEVLLGYKSTNSTYGAGVVYAPYVNWVSGLVTDPDNFNSIRGFFSRYALHKVVRGQWHYGKVTVSNLRI